MLDFSKDPTHAQLLEASRSRFIMFYFSTMLVSACIACFYGVKAFAESPECLSDATQSKYNITPWFDASFKGGFALNVSCFAYHAFAMPFVRKMRQESILQSPSAEPVTTFQASSVFSLMASGVESILALTMFVSSALFLIILRSDMGMYCMDKYHEIYLNGRLLALLAIF